MRNMLSRAAVAALVMGAVAVAATEARAQYSRRTPIVEAVQKTKKSIITIKVDKRGAYTHREVIGTGVIVDERGYAVTNCHVVSGALSLTVRLWDDTSVDAEVLVEDSSHDLAIVRLSRKRTYQALAFAPGSDLMVGETVIAVGHPFGYVNSVSTGIVSAVGREITMPGGETLTNLIQTNASINPGNSGGPLLNINGELIGINAALRDGAQNIAFALNSDTVQRVLSRHLSAAKLRGMAHGLTCHEVVVTTGAARQRVVVDKVAADSPAARAGLKRGDVIVRVAARLVTNRFDLERALWNCKDCDRIEAAVLRAGKEQRIALKQTTGGGERVSLSH